MGRFWPRAISRAGSLEPDSLQASDGKQYQRDTQDQWRHDGVAAEGNVPSELNATRERLQPALEQHGQALAQMPARQAPTPTPQQQDQANTEAAYAAYGVAPNAQTAGAIQLAVQRTREANGIDAATSSLALQRDTTAQYSVYSPIQHLSRDADGAVRVAAMTSTDDIHQALSEVQSLRQEQPPSAGAPERRSNALTHSRPKSAMLTSKRCGRLIGKVCLRKKRSKPQALRRQRLPPRMWMKPEHLRRPLMRSEIETLHVHPMRLLLRRRQRLLLSRWLHPSTRLCRKTCARSPSLPNRSPNLSRNENPKRPKHLRLGHPDSRRSPAEGRGSGPSLGGRICAEPWISIIRFDRPQSSAYSGSCRNTALIA